MALFVIDISRHNGSIDFSKVKQAVDGVIIRIGYRGYGDGSLQWDDMADHNIKECIRYRIPYGVYFFSQALDYLEGKAEAEWTLSKLKGYEIQPEYPVYIDTEWANNNHNGRADGLTREMRTDAVTGFMDTIERAGYYAGIYASTSWYYSYLIDDRLVKFSHWVAHYGVSAPTYKGRYAMWQYTSGGSIAGINGRVDLNHCYVEFPKIIRENGLNGWTKSDQPFPEPDPEPVIHGISNDPVRMVMGPASEGDINNLLSRLRHLEIPRVAEDGHVYTEIPVSSGDQITLLKLCRDLGVTGKQYVELVVHERTTKDPIPDPPKDPEEKLNLLIRLIKWILSIFER